MKDGRFHAGRILIGGWAMFVVAVALELFFPRQILRYLGLPIIIFAILLALSSLLYVIGYALRQRMKQPPMPVSHLVERILGAAWILVIGGLLAALLFPREKWVPAPEIILGVFVGVVVLSSLAYAGFLMLRQVMKRVGRG